MRDDLEAKLKRFEKRNEPLIVAAAETRRLGRLVLFNRQELLLRTIAQAALDACRELGIPPSSAHGELVPNPETKRFEVHLVIDDGVAKARAPADEQIATVMRDAFAQALLMSSDARERMAADLEAFPEVAPADVVDEPGAKARLAAWFKA